MPDQCQVRVVSRSRAGQAEDILLVADDWYELRQAGDQEQGRVTGGSFTLRLPQIPA